LSQGICKDYITATLLEQTRREQFKEDAVRNVELSAYLTHCKMQPLHMLISLRQAMTSSVKLVKNYNTAAGFARRLLELNPKAEHKEMALKVRRPFTLSVSLASFLIHTRCESCGDMRCTCPGCEKMRTVARACSVAGQR
jgi:hypothetical protein